MTKLDDRVALVTGASRGIGLAVAKALAGAGALVVINDVFEPEVAAEAVEQIRAAGGRVEYQKFSVTDREAVTAAVKSIGESHGKVDILVNNAGISRDGLLLRYKDDDWDQTLDVNLSGAYNCSRAVAWGMTKQRWGRIVNMASVVGQSGNAGQIAYSASKAGLIGMTKTVAREMASRSITCNAVAPGFIDTEMTRALPEKARDAIKAMIPLGDLGQPDDVANAVLFLCAPEARYITGQVLGVNGGMFM